MKKKKYDVPYQTCKWRLRLLERIIASRMRRHVHFIAFTEWGACFIQPRAIRGLGPGRGLAKGFVTGRVWDFLPVRTPAMVYYRV